MMQQGYLFLGGPMNGKVYALKDPLPKITASTHEPDYSWVPLPESEPSINITYHDYNKQWFQDVDGEIITLYLLDGDTLRNHIEGFNP